MAGGRYNMVLHKHGDTLYQNVEELFRERSVALCEKARHAPPPLYHPGGNTGANLESISHRCHPILVAFVWELTKETIELPLGCLPGGSGNTYFSFVTLATTILKCKIILPG